MKKIISIIAATIFTFNVFAQNTVINESFDGKSFPFDNWTEFNTTGSVTIVNNELKIDYTTQRPGVNIPFRDISGFITTKFKVKSSRSWLAFYISFLNNSGDKVAMISVGNEGSKGIVVARELDQNEQPSLVENAMVETFQKDVFYDFNEWRRGS